MGLLVLIFLIILVIFPWLPPTAVPVSATNLDPNPAVLRVMTYNIRHAEGMDGKVRPEAIVKELRSGHADVIALQEVDRYQWRSGFQDQARYFAAQLGMHYTYTPAIRSGFSQYGIALLSRYPLEAPQRFILSGGREPRCLLTAELHVGGRTITVATTHLGVAAPERERQLPQLLDVLERVNRPLLLMGDFNSGSPGVQALGLTQLRFPAATSTVLKGGEIDHIFVSSDLASAVPVSVIPSRASDHLPVVAALTLKSDARP